jgi:hypothetical protein
MEKLNIHGHVLIKDGNGNVLVDGDNIITFKGKETVAKMVGGPLTGGVVPSIQRMSLGNGGVDPGSGVALAPPPTQDSLENIILTDDSIDTVSVDLALETKKVTFTSTFNATNVQDFGNPTFPEHIASEVGLITSEGLLFAIKNFDRLTFDKTVPSVLQITWTIFIP